MGTNSEKIKKDYQSHEEVERHWPQILVILICAINTFTEGLHFAWTSPFIPQIIQDKENYNISEKQAFYFATIYPIAVLIGCPVFSILCDKIGRKKTCLLNAVGHIFSWLLAAFAKDVYTFYASRFFAGLSNACYFAAFPIYVGEIANPTVRGSWGNVLTSSVYCGELAINVIGNYFNVRETSIVCLPLPILFMILFSFMPESPHYCIMRDKEAEAKKALQFLTRKNNIENDYIKLKCDLDRQLSEMASWSDVFKIKSNRRAITAGSFLRLTQQTSGMGIFYVFTQTIFQKSGGNVNKELSSIIFMGLNVVLNLLVLFFIVHKFQRRTLYIGSLIGSGTVLYILGTYFFVEEYFKVDFSSLKWIPITSMIIYQMFASFGICVIPTLMMSELYSVSIKAKAMMLLSIVMALGTIVINTSFYYIDKLLGFQAPFYIYAICNSVAAILSFYIIPETKGKTLEEIQQLLKKKIVKKNDLPLSEQF